MIKLCKDCAHFKATATVRAVGDDGRYGMKSRENVCWLLSLSMVTGEFKYLADCDTQRTQKCGIDARFFVPATVDGLVEYRPPLEQACGCGMKYLGSDCPRCSRYEHEREPWR